MDLIISKEEVFQRIIEMRAEEVIDIVVTEDVILTASLHSNGTLELDMDMGEDSLTMYGQYAFLDETDLMNAIIDMYATFIRYYC